MRFWPVKIRAIKEVLNGATFSVDSRIHGLPQQLTFATGDTNDMTAPFTVHQDHNIRPVPERLHSEKGATTFRTFRLCHIPPPSGSLRSCVRQFHRNPDTLPVLLFRVPVPNYIIRETPNANEDTLSLVGINRDSRPCLMSHAA